MGNFFVAFAASGLFMAACLAIYWTVRDNWWALRRAVVNYQALGTDTPAAELVGALLLVASALVVIGALS